MRLAPSLPTPPTRRTCASRACKLRVAGFPLGFHSFCSLPSLSSSSSFLSRSSQNKGGCILSPLLSRAWGLFSVLFGWQVPRLEVSGMSCTPLPMFDVPLPSPSPVFSLCLNIPRVPAPRSLSLSAAAPLLLPLRASWLVLAASPVCNGHRFMRTNGKGQASSVAGTRARLFSAQKIQYRTSRSIDLFLKQYACN